MERKIQPTSVRIPPELKIKLEAIAEREHWSFNQSIIEAIKVMVKYQGIPVDPAPTPNEPNPAPIDPGTLPIG